MNNPTDEPLYTIAAVSKLTGVSTDTLRVWERRFGWPRPARSGSGQRRYPKSQVDLLQIVQTRVGAGEGIGKVLDSMGLIGSRSGSEAEVSAARPASAAAAVPANLLDPRAAFASKLLDLLVVGDLNGAHRLLDDAAFSPEETLRVLEFALIEIGERWYRRRAAIHQEHLASEFVRHELIALLREARRRNVAPRATALLTTARNERHEGGLLAVACALELAGWRAMLLGPDLPSDEIAQAVRRLRPDAVLVSFALSRSVTSRFEELGRLATDPDGAPVFVGGRSVLNHRKLAREHNLVPITAPLDQIVPLLDREIRNRERG